MSMMNGVRKNRHGGDMRRNAFTLVELLVVIGLLLLLLTILFPIGRRVYDRANTAKCTANLKGWGVAINGYMIETGLMPAEGMQTGGGGLNIFKTNAWFNVLPPRFDCIPLMDQIVNMRAPRPDGTKMETIYFCPEFSMSDITNGTPTAFDPVFGFGYNLWIDHLDRAESANDDHYVPNGLMRIDDIHSPADFVVFGEVNAFQFDNMAAAHMVYRHNHGNAGNLAFADGSVRTYDKEDIYVNGSEGNWKSINRTVVWDPMGDPTPPP